MVLTHKPGEKLYVDFAGKNYLILIRIQENLFIVRFLWHACLFSDYAFAMVVKTQGIDDFIYALKCCLAFFGGCPTILVPDNLKSAIIKANRYEPDVNRALEDFCNHYHISVVPARVASPRDKALVENQVKIIYTRVFAKLRKQQFLILSCLTKLLWRK